MPNRRDIESTFATRYASRRWTSSGITGLSASRAISIGRDLIAGASAERLEMQVETAVLVAAADDRASRRARARYWPHGA